MIPLFDHVLSGQPFSTYDRNNYGICAVSGHGSTAPGGWWYKGCFYINLNYNYGGPLGFIRTSWQMVQSHHLLR